MRRRIISRRQFLAVALGLPVATAAAYASWIEPHWLEITRRDLPLSDLPAALEGRTVAHLSDLHVGSQVDEDYLAATLARVAALHPDLVVHTGDLVTYDGSPCLIKAERVLAAWPRAPLGSFAVLGNHDSGSAWAEPEVARQVVAVLERGGVEVLRNRAVEVAGLRLIGVDDLWAGRADVPLALASREVGQPAIALCHNPDACDLPGWDDFRGWILAGHTHGGQCKPPFLPPPLLPVRNRRYTSGAFDLSGSRQLYVSRGVGHLLRARWAVRPEVALFTLRRAN